jgi:hypothetical protein
MTRDEDLRRCDRCEASVDLAEEPLVAVAWEERDAWVQEGVLSDVAPPQRVCAHCNDRLLELLENCSERCWQCAVTQEWGLSIKECLLNKVKWELIPVRKPTQEEWTRALTGMLWIRPSPPHHR